jgi:serine/threonine protein kinase/tetratricopeptide (TPR) repeat protein
MSDAGPNVKVIFGEALDRATPDEQAAYLDRACGGDRALRARLEALLRAYQRAGQFLEGPPVPADRAPTEAPGAVPGPSQLLEPMEAPGAVLGSYRLLEPIGEGGFGIVYRAEQYRPVRRRVALKVLRPGMEGRQVVARFEAERQALALMDHPNISRVLDAGEAAPAYAGGPPRPYFVMELVEGEPLTDFCDQGRLTPRDRLGLFVSACRAVQHAHQKGIIHRDLKPSNVLATVRDGVPVVKVIDFGIAKALQQRLTDRTLVTGVAQVVGTPLYMSPEQAEPGAVDVDTRSDIYSLGVLLYELLTGTTPFDKERLREASFEELRRILREEEAPRPSARVSTLGPAALTLSEQRRTDPRQLGQLLRGELDWVVMKCLEKDRSRRYETANALARDIERYLRDEPVEACPPLAAYRLGKFLRKHRRPLLTAAAFLVVLVAGGVLVGWQAVREAEAERDRAVEEARRGAAVREALDRVRALREEARKTHDRGKWARAREQAQRALALVESGPAEEALAAQVRQVQDELEEEERDRRLVADLEAARLAQAETLGGAGRFADERALPLYRKAFRAYGLPVGEGDPGTAAARLRRRPPEVRQAVSAAVENWLEVAAHPHSQVREPYLDWLRALAAAEVDGGGMREMRAAWHETDPARRRATLERLAVAADVLRWPPRTLVNLAERLRGAGATQRAVQLLRQAWRQYPADFWVNEDLGMLVRETDPQRWPEAVRHLTAAVALRPDSPGAHLNLGLALEAGGKRDDAIACFHRAVAMDPRYASAHCGLGMALQGKGRLDEAIACYRRALELDPKLPSAHCNLGVALEGQGRLDEAITCYRRALEIDPKMVKAQYNLGVAFQRQGQLDEAVACFRRAVEIDPKFAPGLINLGVLLKAKGRVDEAITCYRRAVEIDPKHAKAHFNLGLALYGKGRLDEAIGCYRRAIELDSKYAEAHCNLGGALTDKGDFRAALASLRTGHALGSRRKDWPYPSAKWVKRCERDVQLDDLLAAIQKGNARPAGAAECLELAEFCLTPKQCPAAAVRFYTEAFTAEPKLAADLPAAHRYRAAVSAALAGSGQSRDAAGLGAAERARLRRQALQWLRADLALWTTQRAAGSPQARQAARARMHQWLSEPGLRGVREAPGLAGLPAGERRLWQAFWADVAAVRADGRPAQKPPARRPKK